MLTSYKVPFYQPLAALEIFNRAIADKDIATGMSSTCNYTSYGTARSTYREGNATVQFEVLPSNAKYNTSLNGPDSVAGNGTAASGGSKRKRAKRAFKPSYLPLK
jgi:hypothetical protein